MRVQHVQVQPRPAAGAGAFLARGERVASVRHAFQLQVGCRDHPAEIERQNVVFKRNALGAAGFGPPIHQQPEVLRHLCGARRAVQPVGAARKVAQHVRVGADGGMQRQLLLPQKPGFPAHCVGHALFFGQVLVGFALALCSQPLHLLCQPVGLSFMRADGLFHLRQRGRLHQRRAIGVGVRERMKRQRAKETLPRLALGCLLAVQRPHRLLPRGFRGGAVFLRGLMLRQCVPMRARQSIRFPGGFGQAPLRGRLQFRQPVQRRGLPQRIAQRSQQTVPSGQRIARCLRVPLGGAEHFVLPLLCLLQRRFVRRALHMRCRMRMFGRAAHRAGLSVRQGVRQDARLIQQETRGQLGIGGLRLRMHRYGSLGDRSKRNIPRLRLLRLGKGRHQVGQPGNRGL